MTDSTRPQPKNNGLALNASLSGANNDPAIDADEEQLVIFQLADEQYGLNIAVVESIIKLQTITPVPHANPYVEGVTNLRGTVLPVISLCRRFNMPVSAQTRDTRIVVVEADTIMLGLIVDAVTEVLRVSASLIEPPSPFVATVDSTFITGIARLPNRLVTLLDLEKIFGKQTQES